MIICYGLCNSLHYIRHIPSLSYISTTHIPSINYVSTTQNLVNIRKSAACTQRKRFPLVIQNLDDERIHR